jgi:hypothetical protein
VVLNKWRPHHRNRPPYIFPPPGRQVNPANPTGVLLTRAELDRAAALTAAAGAWLVIDNT